MSGRHARPSRVLFSLLALGLFCAGLGALEAVLRAVGFEGSPDRDVSWCREHVGIRSPLLPAMDLDGFSSVYRAPSMAAHPRPFPVRKARHELRVFVVGSSAAHGYGFSRNGSFSSALQEMLSRSWPSVDPQVINCGTIAWSSQQHLQLVKEIVGDLEPDLLVVYAGNNEMLEWWDWRQYLPPAAHRAFTFGLDASLRLSRWRSFLLLREGLRRVGARPGTSTVYSDDTALPWSARARMRDADRRYAERNFTRNLERIVELARLGDVPVVLSTVAVNEAMEPGLFPFEGDEEARLLRLEPVLDEVDRILSGERGADAIPERVEALFEIAFRAWPEAVVHHRWGEACRRHGFIGLAKHHFAEAIRLDENPHRAQPFINAAIRAVAKARGVPLADGADAVARLSPDGILDYTQIYDHCHPTPDTHLTLARTIGERVIEELRPPDPDGEPDAPAAVERELRREFEREHREDPDRVETWLGMPLVFGQASWPGDPQSADRERWIAMRASMKGAGSPAWNHLGVLAYHGFKAECSMEDVPCLQDAVDAFRRAIDLDPADPLPRANLGRVLLEAGRTREGVESLEAALALDPGDRAAVTLLARTKRWARQGG